MDPFATLGLPQAFDVDLGAVEKTHRELSRALHPDRYLGASASERRAALERAVAVNEAWRIVRDPIRRAEALLGLRGVEMGETGAPPASPEFLMEMIEQREALSEARRSRDVSAVKTLAASIEARSRSVQDALAHGFGRVAAASASEASELNDLRGKLGELRFYRRFLDEVSAIEDELAA